MDGCRITKVENHPTHKPCWCSSVCVGGSWGEMRHVSTLVKLAASQDNSALVFWGARLQKGNFMYVCPVLFPSPPFFKVTSSSPGCPRTCFVAQGNLLLPILLHLLLRWQDYKGTPHLAKHFLFPNPLFIAFSGGYPMEHLVSRMFLCNCSMAKCWLWGFKWNKQNLSIRVRRLGEKYSSSQRVPY